MPILPVILLLILAIFLSINLFAVSKRRIGWVLLTTFSIILVVVVGGIFSCFTNSTFRREFMVFFQPTSQYADGETNAILPLPAHTAFDYRYTEHLLNA